MTPPPGTIDWNRIGRYLAGEATAEESAEVRHWLETHPSDAALIQALQEATGKVTPARPVDIEGALARVKARHRAATRSPALRLWPVAAAAVAILAIGIFVQDRVRTRAEPAVTYQTAAGRLDTIRLGDGSTVVLAPASRLSVRGRQAELAGEAYFDVVHDERRPFTVRTEGVVVRDVGTRFTVLGVAGQPVRVVVTEGMVAVTRAADSVTLDQGDVAEVRRDGIATSRGAATADDVAWTQGRLVFRNAPLPQVVADLRRWYGVELRVADSMLLRRHFTGSFVNESADRVVEVIALALGARVQRRGDTTYLAGAAAPR